MVLIFDQGRYTHQADHEYPERQIQFEFYFLQDSEIKRLKGSLKGRALYVVSNGCFCFFLLLLFLYSICQTVTKKEH